MVFISVEFLIQNHQEKEEGRWCEKKKKGKRNSNLSFSYSSTPIKVEVNEAIHRLIVCIYNVYKVAPKIGVDGENCYTIRFLELLSL